MFFNASPGIYIPGDFKEEAMIEHAEAESSYSGGIYIQFASVKTEHWEQLPANHRIEISITNSNGKFDHTMPIDKKDFLRMFFPVGENLYQRKVKVKINHESNLAELTVLDETGQDTDKKIIISPTILHQDYQLLSGN
jgi:hypothetical protein